jgi:hypothetical protein
LNTVYNLRFFFLLTGTTKSRGLVLSVQDDEVCECDDVTSGETEMGEDLSVKTTDWWILKMKLIYQGLEKYGGMCSSLVNPVPQHSGILKSENISARGLKCSLGKVKAVSRGFEFALSSNDCSDCLHCGGKWTTDTSTFDLMKGFYK